MTAGGSKPDLIIAGAQKSGTTSLLRYLSQHPYIVTHATREFAFFADDIEFGHGWEAALDRYVDRAALARADMKLVVKSAVLYSNDLYIDRLTRMAPDCRVVLVLRDPVHRAFSSFQMEATQRGSMKPFEALKSAASDPEHGWIRFLRLGLYADALNRIRARVPSDSIDVFLFEDLVADPNPICQQLFESLGLARHPLEFELHNQTRDVRSRAIAKATRRLRHRNNPIKRAARAVLPHSAFDRLSHAVLALNRGKPSAAVLSDEMSEWLAAYYEEPNERLAAQLGRPLPWLRRNARPHSTSA